MARHIGIQFFVACAAATIACSSEQAVQPIPNAAPEVASPTLELKPDRVSMVQGDEMQLSLIERNGGAAPKLFSARVSWSSSAPSVATVSGTGYLRGIAPGTAEISATLTIGNDARSVGMTVTVLEPVISDTVVFTAGSDGWQPKIGHVRAGGIVEWRSGGVSEANLSGTIWLMNMDFTVLATLDSNNGPLTYRISTPGEYRFCSGSCWDPPEFGIIYSH